MALLGAEKALKAAGAIPPEHKGWAHAGPGLWGGAGGARGDGRGRGGGGGGQEAPHKAEHKEREEMFRGWANFEASFDDDGPPQARRRPSRAAGAAGESPARPQRPSREGGGANGDATGGGRGPSSAGPRAGGGTPGPSGRPPPGPSGPSGGGAGTPSEEERRQRYREYVQRANAEQESTAEGVFGTCDEEIDRIMRLGSGGGGPRWREILRLPRSATQGQVRKQYYKLSSLVHPDKSSNPRAKEAQQLLNGAREQLFAPAADDSMPWFRDSSGGETD